MDCSTAPELVTRPIHSPEPPEVDFHSNYPQIWNGESEGAEALRHWPLQPTDKEAFNVVEKEELAHQATAHSADSSNQGDEKASNNDRKARRLGRRARLMIMATITLFMLGAGVGIGFAVGWKRGSSSATTSNTGIFDAPARSDGRCGPDFGGAVCSPTSMWGRCCSSHGWCGDNSAHCSPSQGCIWGCTSPSNSSSTTAPVTSGTSGIAAFSCNSTSNNRYTVHLTSAFTKFSEVCYTDFLTGKQTWNATSKYDVVSEVASPVTVYSFQSCMDQCASYNRKLTGNATACGAVTYSANLTWSVQSFGGNCFLKNERGYGYNGDTTIDYSLMASAYVVS